MNTVSRCVKAQLKNANLVTGQLLVEHERSQEGRDQNHRGNGRPGSSSLDSESRRCRQPQQ